MRIIIVTCQILLLSLSLSLTFKMAGAGIIPFQVAIHIIVFITTSFSTKTSLLVILEQPIQELIYLLIIFKILIKKWESIFLSKIEFKKR